MASRYDKNFTARGYTMNYFKMPETGASKSHVLQFLIEIKGISPRIWRRIQVPSNYNFRKPFRSKDAGMDCPYNHV
jgi:hypothetical protein